MSRALHVQTQKVEYGQGFFGSFGMETMNRLLCELCGAEPSNLSDDTEIEINIHKLKSAIDALQSRESWALNILRAFFRFEIKTLFTNINECANFIHSVLLSFYENGDKDGDSITLTWF